MDVYAFNIVLDEFTILKGELSESALTSLRIRTQINHYTVFTVREFNVKRSIELKPNSITAVGISIISSTSRNITIATLAPEEVAVSVAILQEEIDALLDVIPKRSIADNCELITQFLIALRDKNVKSLLKPCNRELAEDKLRSKTFYLRYRTFRSPDFSASFWIMKRRFSVAVDVGLPSCLLAFTNLKEILYENFFAFRKFINRIIILTLADSDEILFHRFVHRRVIDITTVSGDITSKFFSTRGIFGVAFL